MAPFLFGVGSLAIFLETQNTLELDCLFRCLWVSPSDEARCDWLVDEPKLV